MTWRSVNITATVVENAWMEVCLISIQLQGNANNVEFAGLTRNLEIDPGDKDIEGLPLLNGGRIRMWKPQGDATVSFEAIALYAATDTGTTGKGFFDMMNTVDGTAPMLVPNDRKRNLYRIAVEWTTNTAITSAKTIGTANDQALRMVFADCVFTSVKTKFDPESGVVFSVTAKCCAFDKTGSANMKFESSEGASGSDILPALADYTVSAKW